MWHVNKQDNVDKTKTGNCSAFLFFSFLCRCLAPIIFRGVCCMAGLSPGLAFLPHHLPPSFSLFHPTSTTSPVVCPSIKRHSPNTFSLFLVRYDYTIIVLMSLYAVLSSLTQSNLRSSQRTGCRGASVPSQCCYEHAQAIHFLRASNHTFTTIDF